MEEEEEEEEGEATPADFMHLNFHSSGYFVRNHTRVSFPVR